MTLFVMEMCPSHKMAHELILTIQYMSQICIHLGVHNHHVLNGTCCVTLDVACQCVASEVMKILNAKKLYYCNGNKQTNYG